MRSIAPPPPAAAHSDAIALRAAARSAIRRRGNPPAPTGITTKPHLPLLPLPCPPYSNGVATMPRLRQKATFSATSLYPCIPATSFVRHPSFAA